MIQVDTRRKPPSSYDKKRLQVLAAAARVFYEVGYDKASMRRIAAEAKASIAGLYYYVSSKEELLYLIQLHTFDSLLHGLQSSLAGIIDPRERLSAAVRNHIRHCGHNTHELKVCTRELETLNGNAYAEVHARRRTYFEAVHALVKELQPHQTAPVSSWLATANLFGMLNWFYQWYNAERPRLSLDDLASQQTALFLDGYIASASNAQRGGNG
jgi:AcrR family transcriptional regulator